MLRPMLKRIAAAFAGGIVLLWSGGYLNNAPYQKDLTGARAQAGGQPAAGILKYMTIACPTESTLDKAYAANRGDWDEAVIYIVSYGCSVIDPAIYPGTRWEMRRRGNPYSLVDLHPPGEATLRVFVRTSLLRK